MKPIVYSHFAPLMLFCAMAAWLSLPVGKWNVGIAEWFIGMSCGAFLGIYGYVVRSDRTH
jgi:hypothetical protein